MSPPWGILLCVIGFNVFISLSEFQPSFCEANDGPAADHSEVTDPPSHREHAWPPSLTECWMQGASIVLEAHLKMFRAASWIN